jgi:D-3-phosphoglycerate dehydrogenase
LVPIKRILLPQPIEKEALSLLEAENLKIVLASDKRADIVAPLLKGVQAVILRTGIIFSKELMTHADDLWMISRTGAGVDNVDVAAATEMGILVTCVPGANTPSVVEHALALILALAKQLLFMDGEVRQDHFDIRFKNLPRDLKGKTLGVIGLGRIGSELARICHLGFGMKILAHDPYLTSEAMSVFQGWVDFCDMERLFRNADIISIHIPLLPNTKKLIGAREFGWMKSDAFLINTSRGGVLDEQALFQWLREKKIAGAGLDVFAQEPLEKENPIKKLDNVILTPHTAALTRECVIRLATEAAKAVIEVLHGKRPQGMVNPEVLAHPRWRGFSLA